MILANNVHKVFQPSYDFIRLRNSLINHLTSGNAEESNRALGPRPLVLYQEELVFVHPVSKSGPTVVAFQTVYNRRVERGPDDGASAPVRVLWPGFFQVLIETSVRNDVSQYGIPVVFDGGVQLQISSIRGIDFAPVVTINVIRAAWRSQCW